MEKEKEKYEAWFYYLRELPEYKIYCDWRKKKGEDPESPWPNKEPASFELALSYDFFGNIFNVEFDEWYKKNEDLIEEKKKWFGGVFEYTKHQANYEFNVAFKETIASKGTDLSINEFIDEFRDRFMNRLFDHIPGSFLSRTCLNPVLDPKDLKSQFGKLVSEKRESPNIKEWEEEIAKGWVPVGERISPERLMRFLKVKQLEDEGLNFADIEYELNPDGNEGKDPAINYGDKARNILENVKNGIFPGKYTEKLEADKKS